MDSLSQHYGGMVVETKNHVLFQAPRSDLDSVPASNISLNGNGNESRLHSLEKGAYIAVLRAFCAQSNALSWGKEELITELRKELRVSDVEHRQILAEISSDKSIKLLRESGKHSEAQLEQQAEHRKYDVIYVGPRKKKLKAGAVSTVAPVPDYIPPPAQSGPAIKPARNITKNKGNDKKHVFGGPVPPRPCMHSLPVPVPHLFNQNGYHASALAPPPATAPAPTLTPVPVPKAFKSINRELLSKKKSISGAIHIQQTDKLIQRINEVCRYDNPDSAFLQNAKKILKDHERALVEAISKLGDMSDNEEPPKKGHNKGDNKTRHRNMSLLCIEGGGLV
ncbi:Emsy N Terminus (ENT) domain-containing protein [Rhynchospora pubera]|uniref:Emsy N Terminus (ENT) domain-containing protein n=1 Tax=Rhynchospora pubera TaxID=906938 RepID=A0AAV8G2H5_9POAL|nr:Emsy N Terminus (ENT) domain-containing protein [Rhynchospora pubera]